MALVAGPEADGNVLGPGRVQGPELSRQLGAEVARKLVVGVRTSRPLPSPSTLWGRHTLPVLREALRGLELVGDEPDSPGPAAFHTAPRRHWFRD